MVDQLQAQLAVERACVAELQRELDAALKQLDAARAALADKTLLLRLVATPCASEMVH
jgi:capsule polysaccharide export protein KpsE/RkpR